MPKRVSALTADCESGGEMWGGEGGLGVEMWGAPGRYRRWDGAPASAPRAHSPQPGTRRPRGAIQVWRIRICLHRSAFVCRKVNGR
eukprot:1192816-Prorocentrum_minimum.AAC.7